jgi:hypothetical protein
VTGKFNLALDLSIDGGYLESIGDESVLDLQTFTLGFWLSPNGSVNPTVAAPILMRRRGSDTLWAMLVDGHGGSDSNRELTVQFWLDNGSTISLTVGKDLVVSYWHFVVVVVDASASTVTLYLDGSPVDTESISGRTILWSATDLLYAGNNGNFDYPDYYLDQVGIWSSAKDADWVGRMWANGDGRVWSSQTQAERARGVSLNALGFLFGVDERRGSRIGHTRWAK